MSVTSSSSRRPLGKPAKSPARTPKRLPCPTGALGAMPVFSRMRSALVVPGEVQTGHAREEDGLDVAAGRLRRVVEHRVQRVGELRDLGAQVVRGEARVTRGIRGVPAVLLPERDDDLVDQGVGEPGDLHPAPLVAAPAVRVDDLDALAAGGRVHAEHGLRIVRGVQLPVAGELRDRDLKDDRVRVEAADAVHPVLRAERDDVSGVERPQAGEVEHRAEIDEERIVALAGERLDAAGQLLNRGLHERAVVRGRARPDVDRRRRQVPADDGRLVLLHPGDRVVLRPVPVRVGERVDRAGVVEERVAVPGLRPEVELVGHVLPSVSRRVDLELVEHVVAERVEVRPAGGLLERDVVGNDRDRVGPVGAHERVHVRVVRNRVLADRRSLSVARRRCVVRARAAHEHGRESGERQHPDERDASHFPLLRGGLNAPYSGEAADRFG